MDNSTAYIEAGTSRAEIQDQFSVQGLLLCHEPNSFDPFCVLYNPISWCLSIVIVV